MATNVPPILKPHILPFDWNQKKVWALDAPTVHLDIKNLEYLLHLPLWSSRQVEGFLFDTKPIDVINNPELVPYQYERIEKTDLTYPMDFLRKDGHLWILDGAHRLAKHYILKKPAVPIRIHNQSVIDVIKIDDGKTDFC